MNEDQAERRMRLLDLPPGVAARLCGDSGGGDGHARLAEMGFVPGTLLRIVRAAPLGDPVEIEIRDTRVCARRADLREFFVTPEENG